MKRSVWYTENHGFGPSEHPVRGKHRYSKKYGVGESEIPYHGMVLPHQGMVISVPYL